MPRDLFGNEVTKPSGQGKGALGRLVCGASPVLLGGEGSRVHVGCSGYHYPDWVGTFYPPSTPQSEFLARYFASFAALEVNQTFYRAPTSRTTGKWASKLPLEARLAVKLPSIFTHERTAGAAEAGVFVDAMKPLQEQGLLACVLAQFPFSFKPNRQSGDDVRKVVDHFAGLGLAVEIRNAAWQRDAFYDYLRQAQVALCTIDAPSLPGLPTGPVPQTAPFAYVRMHGRNEEKWWNHERPEERYTYLYSKPELTIWSERVKRMSQDTKNIYVFFNNHFEGRAPANALTLLELLSND